MTTEQPQPKLGPGKFQWNTAGWFGGLLGGTFFLLIGSIVFANNQPIVSTIWISCFLVTNFAGIYIWSRRFTLYPYPAMQWLLAIVGVSITLAVSAAYLVDPQLLVAFKLSPIQIILMLLIIPGLMFQFHFTEMSARRNLKSE